jgi:hypothetical protein
VHPVSLCPIRRSLVSRPRGRHRCRLIKPPSKRSAESPPRFGVSGRDRYGVDADDGIPRLLNDAPGVWRKLSVIGLVTLVPIGAPS